MPFIPVRVALGVQWAHVIDLTQVDIREDQFVVTGVDDSGTIRASEHICSG